MVLLLACKKTIIMSLGSEDHNFTANESFLKEVDAFTYFDFSLSKNMCVDYANTITIGKSSIVFGRPTKRVWKNRHFSIRT